MEAHLKNKIWILTSFLQQKLLQALSSSASNAYILVFAFYVKVTVVMFESMCIHEKLALS